MLEYEARRVLNSLTRIAGLEPSWSNSDDCKVEEGILDPVFLAYNVERARRGEASKTALLCSATRKALSQLPEEELRRLATYPLESEIWREYNRARGSLGEILTTLRGYHRERTLERLIPLLVAIARSLSTPCRKDPVLEEEVERWRKRMNRLGVLLGVLLPIMFVLSILRQYLVALASLAVTAVLWVAVREIGMRFRMADTEAAWAECSLTYRQLEMALGPPRLPVHEILRLRME